MDNKPFLSHFDGFSPGFFRFFQNARLHTARARTACTEAEKTDVWQQQPADADMAVRRRHLAGFGERGATSRLDTALPAQRRCVESARVRNRGVPHTPNRSASAMLPREISARAKRPAKHAANPIP